MVLLEVLETTHESTLAVHFAEASCFTLAMQLTRHVKEDGNRYTSK